MKYVRSFAFTRLHVPVCMTNFFYVDGWSSGASAKFGLREICLYNPFQSIVVKLLS